jgi:hypothetical protein
MGGLIVVTVFMGCAIFFLACAFAQCSGVWKPSEEKRSVVQEMALEISRQAIQLDMNRLQMFLKWLHAHGSKIHMELPCLCKTTVRLHLEKSAKTWLESLPIKRLLCEYHLILSEISWWRDLEDKSLSKFMSRERYE